MTDTDRPIRRRLDPDVLAAMEEERRFLLRSIADLDAEHRVGDIDDADYASLRDDYTRRAAEVIRAIDGQRVAFASSPGPRRRQVLVWIVGLALLGGVSGGLIARSSGARSAGESVSGGVRQSSISQLNEARTFFGDSEQWDEAIAIYDAVLDDDPSNAEARTYRAWLQYRGGAPAEGPLDAWAEVLRTDADYAEAIVFRAIVLADLQRWDEAETVLESIDPATAPAEIQALISQRGLDGEIYGEARIGAIEAVDQPSLVDLDLTIDQALAAAGHLLSVDPAERSGGPIAALKLYRAVRAVEPDNAAALSREALVLASAGRTDDARALLDQAVLAHPDDAEARLSRATVLASSVNADDRGVVCGDLAVLSDLVDEASILSDRAAEIRAAVGCE